MMGLGLGGAGVDSGVVLGWVVARLEVEVVGG